MAPARQDDTAARTTIERLSLQEKELADLRKAAIQGALSPRKGRGLKLREIRKLRAEMEQAEQELQRGARVQLRAFCFAIKPEVDRKVVQVEAIRKHNGKN